MQTSGFFNAEMDQVSGEYDRAYIAEQFADYFKLFVGNGVFVSPTNQLIVIPAGGLSVIVRKGRAFINGYWYYNDDDIIVQLEPNNTNAVRNDSIRLRWDVGSRDILAIPITGSVIPIRTEGTYELIISNIAVGTNNIIMPQDITDRRPDENVCGFVTGLLKVQTTDDLFAQFRAIFNNWFQTIQGQFDEDLGARVASELNTLRSEFYNNRIVFDATNRSSIETRDNGVLTTTEHSDGRIVQRYVPNIGRPSQQTRCRSPRGSVD